MTTLAIIGTGIVGRSLLYNLHLIPKKFDQITLFSSDELAFPCTKHSTAVVALRGVTKGHSPLGDLLVEGFQEFSRHINHDKPDGVWISSQLTAATTNYDVFKLRFPQASWVRSFFRSEVLLAQEEAFLIDPVLYGDWLLNSSGKLGFSIENDFVTEIERIDGFNIKTLNGKIFKFDKIVFAGGNLNRFWKSLLPESSLETSRPVPGSYLEFNQVELPINSFSLTLDWANLIWNQNRKQILVGSTTSESNLILPDAQKLLTLYEHLSQSLDLRLPDFKEGLVKNGVREKSKKRLPYLICDKNLHFVGGLYKNGFSLSLSLTRKLALTL